MREIRHGDSLAALPPRMLEPVDEDTRADVMTRDELWEAGEVLSRLMTTASRQRLSGEVFEAFDQARMYALALYTQARVG